MAAVAQQQDKAFEVFVKRAVTNIMKEGAEKSWGRGKEAKDLKDACAGFLTLLENQEAGIASFEGSLAVAVLQVLALACTNSNPKVVELALGCLHKLVAHAWLHGESSMFEGLMDDGTDVVSQVIKLVVKCGETSVNEALQLAVIRALLTFTTAEHFVAHGDCLMSAVRAVFNLALGSESQTIKRTACNALLQMLNTVAKRITCSMHHYGSMLSTSTSKRSSDQGEEHLPYPSPPQQQLPSRSSQDHASAMVSAGGAKGTGFGLSAGDGSAAGPGTGENSSLFDGLQVAQPARSPSGAAELANDARTAQFASLAEQSDLRGLEAAIGGAPGGDHEQDVGASGSGAGGTAGIASPRRNDSGGVLGGRTSMGTSPVAELPGAGQYRRSTDVAATALSPARESSRHSPHSPRGLQHSQSLSALSVMERDVLQVLTAFCKLASRESGLTEVESFLHQGKLLALELLAKVLANPQHCWDAVRDEFCRHLTQPLAITLLRNCSAADAGTFQLAIRLLVTIMLKPKLRRLLKPELGAFYPLFVLRPLETGRHDLPTLHTVLGSVRQICSEPQLLVDLFVNYDCDLAAPCLYERTVAALSSLARMSDAELERPQNVGRQAEQAARLAAIRELALKSLLTAVGSLEAWAAPIRDGHARAGDAERGVVVSSGGGVRGADAGDESASEVGSIAGNTPRSSASPFATASAVAAAHVDGELQRLEAVHSRKSALARGLALFNASPVKGVRFLLQQKLVAGGSTPAAVAAFLKEHQPELGKTPLGEYFGHHEDFAVAVMHAWTDLNRSWSGIPIDSALRLLLEQFRLPGEAQKIDRIMEKFAEKYVRDNPGKFVSADGAYVLAFACIMLNTDAHNPLAERRLTKADFVSMNTAPLPAAPAPVVGEGQGEGQDGPAPGDGEGEGADGRGSGGSGGGSAAVPVYRPVLPMAELEGIYDRIVLAEIKLRDDDGASPAAPAPAPVAASRLAAALGLRALAAPYRPVSRGWGRQQQGLTEPERKRQLVKLAERAVLGTGGGAAGGWHASSHAGHARPMLTVTGGPVLEAVTYSLAGTKDAAAAAPLLAALVTLVELAALLGLEELCDACVGALSKAVGLPSPAAHGSPDESKQLAALRSLLGLASSPIAGLLGSGWTVLLQTAATLDALVADLAAGAPAPVQATLGGMGDAGSLANPFNKMFAALGISLAGANPATGRMGSGGGGAIIPVPPRPSLPAAPPRAEEDGEGQDEGGGEPPVPRFAQPASPAALRPGPGAGLALWALSPEGHDSVSRVYTCSASLDGESVVVFFRALCAVSREELDSAPPRPSPSDASHPSQPAPHSPRLYSLQRLLDCAHANTNRIRLIRAKLWAVTAAHLVMVACHPSPAVAVYAVNALHGLSQRLLARGVELAHFEQQEEALRPFVSVLRVCDEPEVRRLAVRSALGSCAGRAAGLGSGWRALLELLRRAGADHHPSVAAEASAALPAVVEALYRLPTPPTPAPAASTDAPPSDSSTPHSDDTAAGSGRAAVANGGGGAPGAGADSALPARPSIKRPSAGARAKTTGASVWLENGSHGYFQETVAAILAVAQNPTQPVQAGLAAVQLLQSCGRRLAAFQSLLLQRQQQQRAAVAAAAAAAAAAAGTGAAVSPPPGIPPEVASAQEAQLAQLEAFWSLLLECLAGWAVGESRAALAEAASQAVLELMASHGAGWGDAAWRVVIRRVLPRLLTPAGAGNQGGAAGAAQPAGVDGMNDFIGRASEAFLRLCDQVWVVPEAFREELLEQLSDTCLSWYRQGDEHLAKLGLRCFELLARRLAQPSNASSWGRLLSRVVALLKEELRALLDPGVWYQKGAAQGRGARAEHKAGHDQPHAPSQSPGHSQGQGEEAVATGRGAGVGPPALRARLLMLMQRLLVTLQERCMAGMPWRVQAPLAAALVEAAGKLQAFNSAQEAAAAAARRDAAPPLAYSHHAYGQPTSRASGNAGGEAQPAQISRAGEVPGAAAAEQRSPVAGPSGRASSEAAASRPGLEDDVQSRCSETLADSILEATSWVPPGGSRLSAASSPAAAGAAGGEGATGTTGPGAGAGGDAGVRGGSATAAGVEDGASTTQQGAEGLAAAGLSVHDSPEQEQQQQQAGSSAAADVQAPVHSNLDNRHHAAAASRSAPAAAAGGVVTSASPMLILTSAESQDSPALCLGRLESEAAAGALSVLCHCIDSEQGLKESQEGQAAGAAAGADGAVFASPEQMLRSFCLHLIATAADAALRQSSSDSPGTAPHRDSQHQQEQLESAGSATDLHPDSNGNGGAGGWGPRDGPSPLEPWHASLRAVNVANAIQLYLHLPAKPGTDSTIDLWQYMVALVGSPHSVVRQAVADYFLSRVAVKLGVGVAGSLSL